MEPKVWFSLSKIRNFTILFYKNCKELDILQEVRLFKQSAENYIRRTKDETFDLIFLDPPYNKDYIHKLLLKIINNFSRNGTLIYIEESNFDFSDFNDSLTLLKETTSGKSYGRLFEVVK